MRWLLAAAALLACGSPSWKRGETKVEGVTQVTYAPAGDPVSRYNDPPILPAPKTRLVETLVKIVADTAEANGRAAPLADGRLCALAEEVAQVSNDGPPPYDAVEFSLSQHGIIEPSPHLLVVRADPSDIDGVARELATRLPAIVTGSRFTRVGAGSATGADGVATYILALQESYVETEPIEREVKSGGSVPIRGKLLHPFGDPHLYVTGANGQVTKLNMVHEGELGFRAEARCEDDGKIQVEIVGSDRSGATVLANFPVYCGQEPPRTLKVVLSSPDEAPVKDAGAAEKRIFEMLNDARVQAGLAPVAWDERLAKVARAHSTEMRDLGYVSHISPTTGSAADRVQRVGVVTPLVLENLARAYSPAEAHVGLMNSPGHRANILSPDATHLGIGVILGKEVAGHPELYVTQVFIRVPPPIDVSSAREQVRKAISKHRKSIGLSEVTRDEGLDRIAQEFAESMARGVRREAANAHADGQLDAFATRYSAILTVVMQIGEPADVAGDAVIDARSRFVGVGVAQAPQGDAGQSVITAVLLFARPR